MKALLAAALLVACFNANAWYCSDGSLIASHPGGDCSVAIPPPASSSPNKSTSRSSAVAAAQAGAVSGSKSSAVTGPSTSSATGGAGGQSNASNSLGSVGNDNSTSKFSALALALPAPVFIPPMPAIGGDCAARVRQSARAVGWNFVSWSDGEVDPDDCTTIKIYQSLMQRCKYQSADMVLAHLTVKVLPGYRPDDSHDVDLTDKECRELSMPITLPVASTPINFLSHIPPSCKPVPAPKGRKIVKRKAPMVCK